MTLDGDLIVLDPAEVITTVYMRENSPLMFLLAWTLLGVALAITKPTAPPPPYRPTITTASP